jgi:fibronectin-binding autotransporter adhesin
MKRIMHGYIGRFSRFCSGAQVLAHFFVAFIAAVLIPVPVANAATLYWNGTATDSPDSLWTLPGVWSISAGATTPAPVAAPGSTDDAVFNITTANVAELIYLNGNQAALSLTFNNTAATTILSGTAPTSPAQTLTLGSSGLTVAGTAGTVTLGTANNPVTLVLASAVGQTWTNNSATTVTLGSPISRGTASTLALAGTGTFTVTSAANTSGILSPWATTGAGTATRFVTVGTGGLLQSFTGTSATVAAINDTGGTVNYEITGGGSLTEARSVNTLRFSGFSTTGQNSNFNLNGKVLTVNGLLAAGPGTLGFVTGGGGALKAGNTGELVISGPQNIDLYTSVGWNLGQYPALIIDGVSGTRLVYNGSGTLTLSGGNTYTGGTVINSGVLALAAGIGSTPIRGSLIINSGATVNADRNWALGYSSGTSVTNITINNGTLSFNSSATANEGMAASTVTMTGGSIIGSAFGWYDGNTTAPTVQTLASASRSTISAGINLRLSNDNNKLTFDMAQGSTVDGIDMLVSGPIVKGTSSVHDGGGIRKIGAGTLVFTGTNSYTGGTLISAGVLQIGNSSTSGSLGTGVVSNNAQLVFKRSDTLTSSGVISGSGSVSQAGAGTLILTSNNSYSGGTLISSGVLQIGDNTASGSAGTGTITNNAQLVFKRSDASTYAGVITGSGSVSQSGAGGLTLAAINSYTGGTVVNSGTLALYAGAASGVIRGTLTLQPGTTVYADRNWALGYNSGTSVTAIMINGGTLSFGSSGAATANEGIAARTVTMTGGSIIGSAFGWYDGNTNSPTVQTLASASRSTIGTGISLRLSNDSNNLLFDVAQGSTVDGIDLLVSGPIVRGTSLFHDGGGIKKAGAGTLRLDGANTYSGATIISAGKLLTGVGNSCVNSAVSLASASGQSATLGISITDNTKQWECKSLTVNNGGTGCILDFNFGATVPSPTVAPLKVTNAATFSTTPTVTVELLRASNVTVGGQYPLMTWGSGGVSYPTSVTVVAAGRSLITGHLILVASTLTLVIDTLTTSEPLSWTGGSGIWDVNNSGNTVWKDNASADTYYQDGDLVVLDNTVGSGGSVTLNTTVMPADVLVNTPTADYTISGSGGIAGGTALTKSGAGGLTLAGICSYFGATAVNNGTLTIGGAGQLGSGRYSNTVSLDNPASTFAYSSSSTQILEGVISGPGTLIQNGPGTLTLSAINNYAGGTVVNGGVLTLGAGGANGIIRGALTINSGATVNADRFYSFGYGGPNYTIGGTNSITEITINNGTLSFNSSATANEGMAARTVTMTGGSITGVAFGWFYGNTTTPILQTLASANRSTISSAICLRLQSVSNKLTFDVAQGSTADGIDLLVSGAILNGTDGGGGVRKTGAGTLKLSAINSYTGGTVVDNGTLTLGPGGEAGVLRGNLTINSGATVTADRNWALGYTAGYSVNTIAINGGTLSFNTNSTADAGLAASTVTMTGGSITGSAFCWYDGNTTTPIVQTLASASRSTITPSIGLRLSSDNNKLTFDVAQGTTSDGIDLLVSGAIVKGASTLHDGGGVKKIGAGTLLLSGNNLYTGSTIVSNGTLRLGANNTLTSTNSITLAGGTLASGIYTNTLGVLTLGADSTLEISLAGRLSFTNSSSAVWTGTLTITGDFTGRRVRFGTDATGLTPEQLAKISPKVCAIDSSGYLYFRRGTIVSFY